MIKALGQIAFKFEPLDSGVAKGDPHDGPRLDGSPEPRGKPGSSSGNGFGDARSLPVLSPSAKPTFIQMSNRQLCKELGENLYQLRQIIVGGKSEDG
jgi:hypothetical protein